MSMDLTSIIFYSLIIVCDLVGLSVTIFLLSLIWLRRSVVKTNRVSYFVINDSYIAFFIVSPLFIEMCIKSIYGQFHPDRSFEGWDCRLKSYFSYVTGSVYFYSFLLQAVYRFCRIIYSSRIAFQSLRLYVILTVAEWVLAVSQLLPSFFFGDIEYLPLDYHCQFAPTNPRGSLIGLTVLFLIPFMLTLICYLYTIHHVRSRTTAETAINQNADIRRDLIILSRLVFLFTFVSSVALPHLLIPISYAIHCVSSSGKIIFSNDSCTYYHYEVSAYYK